MNNIVIEKNIPIPNYRAGLPWREMEIGDSFLIRCHPGEELKYRRRVSAVQQTNKHMRFAMRNVDGGLRVWRIKKKDEKK